MENKETTKAERVMTGPVGRKLPVIANSLVNNLNQFLFPTGVTEPRLEEYETALTGLKECGFDGFMAQVHTQPHMSEELVETVLRKAANHNLFIILCSDTLYSAPDVGWISEVKKDADKLSTLSAKINLFRERYRAYLGEFVNRYKNIPGFGGIALNDEPKYTDMLPKFDPETATLADVETREGTLYCLSNRYSLVRELLFEDEDSLQKDHIVLMMNLVGERNVNHIEDENGRKNYTGYLNTFRNIINGSGESGPFPTLWTYDIYPLSQRNVLLNDYIKQFVLHSVEVSLAENGLMEIADELFYKDQELFQEYSSSCGGRFWYYVQSMQYYTYIKERPYALEQYLRFQIFSNLAMGAKGVIYWTYHHKTNLTGELYLGAPVSMEERKTAAWYYARQINAEIDTYNYIFQFAKLLDWGHVGKTYPGCRIFGERLRDIIHITTDGEGVLVTMLESMGRQYIVMVSHDPENYQEITFRFGFGWKQTILTPQTVVELTPGTITTESKTTLEPGGYMIFKIQNNPTV